MTIPNPIVFRVDVDDTLLDNDRIQDDLKHHIERELGANAETATGRFKKNSSTNWVTEIIWAPSSVSGSDIPMRLIS